MKNSAVEKILNRKIGLKNFKSENQCKKIENSKKKLGQKIRMKNFSRKMEKIGLIHKKILGQSIGVKNSNWKMDEKNWFGR